MDKETFQKVVNIQNQLSRYQIMINMINRNLNTSKEYVNISIKKDEMLDILTLFASKIKELETDIQKL